MDQIMFGRQTPQRHRGVSDVDPSGLHGRDARRGPHSGGRGRAGRFLDHGDLRLIVLNFIAAKPRHGYELIKAIEAAAGGAYAPSPGSIYPILSLLETAGYATSLEAAGGRKRYSATADGRSHLLANAKTIGLILERMGSASHGSEHDRPEVLRAREKLRIALRMKLATGALSPTQIAAITGALDRAALTIEQV